jgi:hypothetical protein
MDRGFRCSNARDVPWPLDTRRSICIQPNCIRWSSYRSASCSDRLPSGNSCNRDDVSSRKAVEGSGERDTSSADVRMKRRWRDGDMLRRVQLCCGFAIRRVRERRSIRDERMLSHRLGGASGRNTTVAFRQASEVKWRVRLSACPAGKGRRSDFARLDPHRVAVARGRPLEQSRQANRPASVHCQARVSNALSISTCTREPRLMRSARWCSRVSVADRVTPRLRPS